MTLKNSEKKIKRFAPFPLLLIWLISPNQAKGLSPASNTGDEKTIEILYTYGWRHGVNLDLLSTFEAFLQTSTASVRLDNIAFKPAYLSNGRYLFDIPANFKKESLPNTAQIQNQETVKILETRESILLAYPKTEYPLLEALLQTAADRSGEGYNPRIQRTTATLAMISDATNAWQPVLITDPNAKIARWQANLAQAYRLTINGREIRVVAIGKPRPGPAAITTALEKRIQRSPLPKLLIFKGGAFLPKKIKSHRHLLLESLEKLGFSIFAPTAGDLSNDDMQPLLRGQKTTSMDIVVANVKALDDTVPFHAKAWVVKNIDGVRVGVFALVRENANGLFASKHLPYRAEEPIAKAKIIVEELRNRQKVDLVVCVSHLLRQDDAKLLFDAVGVDMMIGDSTDDLTSSRQNNITLGDWSQETHRRPALVALMPNYGYGDIKLGFQKTRAGYSLTKIVETVAPLNERAPEDELFSSIQDELLGLITEQYSSEPVLPDPRNLWPQPQGLPKLVYVAEEIWNLTAQIMRETFDAELALVKIQPLRSNVAGAPFEGLVASWLDDKEKIVTMDLPGRDIRALMKQMSFDDVPIHPKDVRPTRYYEKTRLAAAGLDQEARVAGLPLKDNELYRVAVSHNLLNDEKLPEFAHGQNINKHETTLDKVVLAWLNDKKQTQNPENYAGHIKRLCEGKTPPKPLWRINLRQTSLQLANTQVEQAAAYAQVPNARIQAINQVFARGSLKIYSELMIKRLSWDAGFTADYGRLTLKPQNTPAIKNETIDQALVETELKYKTMDIDGKLLKASAGPFISLAYDTEFTKPPLLTGLPRRRLARLKPGFKLFQGQILQELSLGLVWQRNYAKTPKDNEMGWETTVGLSYPLPKTNIPLALGGNYRRINAGAKTAVDLKEELNIRANLRVPLWGNLSLTPFVDFYQFKGRLNQPTGQNIIFGFGLDFNRLWKPAF